MALAFLAFGIMLVRRDALGDEKYNIIRRSMLVAYSGISLIVYGYSLIQLFLYTGRLLDIQERKNNRLFGLFYILFAIGTIILLNLAHRGPIFGFGFIILLFSIHLIPVFFQTLHLDKNFVESVRSPDFTSSLEDFIEKYQISKREKEVIQLISRGKGNQDISDSLFISLQTVKDHIHHIYIKTGVKNRVQLTNLIRSFS